MSSSAAPLIEFRDISKKFGDFYANRGVNLAIRGGEIHAIAGENGAGKTTLMNVLFGRTLPDSGAVLLRGNALRLRSPRDAIRAGIGMVHQDLLFFPQLSVLENIILGNEPSSAGIIRMGAAEKEVLRLRDAFGFKLDPRLAAGELPFAGRQQLELLRILYRGADILILDEPTSFLGPHEAGRLLEVLRSLRAGGRTIIFISHRLGEVFAIADRITVLRRGSVVATLDAEKTGGEEIARLMVGADAGEGAQKPAGSGAGEVRRPISLAADQPPVLDVRDLCVQASPAEPRIENISFTVGKGEIFGFAGIVGNGLRSLAGALAGRVGTEGGRIVFDGSDITAQTVEDRLRAGICRVPENPSEEALLPDGPLWENFLLGRQREGEFQRRGIILKREAIAFTRDQIAKNGIAARGPDEPLSSLSGGNAQKVALARTLSRRPRLAVFEQPSRGLDLHAAARIREALFALSGEGAALVVLSYDLDELISLCDRVAVLFRGKLVGTVGRDGATREVLGRWMVGIE
ncbi:MAG: ABC transporter ATP-binding protein [Syntrophobacteraceae bacterium]